MVHAQKRIIMLMLVAIIFIVGVIFGNTYATFRENSISKLLKQSELDAESFLTEQELFSTFQTNCEFSEKRLNILSGELWNLGKILDSKDAQNKLGDKYPSLKRKFHLMQIRTYILDKKLQDNCGKTFNVILFYFKQSDKKSTEQGIILDKLVKEHNIHVFAIEYQYAKELAFLEQYYDIQTTPSLVINYENTLTGLTNAEQIKPLLHG